MTKRKRKLTSAERAAKKRRKEEFQMVFVNGRQKWIRRRPPLIDGMEEDEFILRNADPIWLHQNEMWWCITEGDESERQSVEREAPAPDDEEVPF